MLLEEARKRVIEIALRAREDKLITLTFGNFSIRDKETGYICITPSGMDYYVLKPEDIVVVDENEKIIDGKRKPSIETPMHCNVYRKRENVFGIVHTHSVFATAWACCEEDIPCAVAEVGCLVGGPIKCSPYRPIGTPELGETAAAYLGNTDAVLLGKHGALAVGPDIDTAYTNAVIVEEGAKIAYYARGIGGLSPIPEEQCRELRKTTIEKYGQKL